MKYYSGLDVSLKETFISIIDENGLVDARHMAAALSARINKNDRNDGRGIAQMMRAGLYKEVQIKSDDSCELKVLLGSRRQLVSNRQQLIGAIRGLMKIYGIKLGMKGTSGGFRIKVEKVLSNLGSLANYSIRALLSSLEAIETSLTQLDKMIGELGKKDKDCQRLMTVPGVGVITAMTYKAALDNPDRFERSETVGAYMGLTPRQYASGEVDRHGSVSRMGPQECRNMLYEAAQSLLSVCKTQSKLKTWGLKLAKKKGKKKAIVAVARKLAVIMHRMLVAKTEFIFH